MPELPEVETVRRGLEPTMARATIVRVEARRPDLRFPLPQGFAERLAGVRIESLDRRGKFLIARLNSPDALIMHLGMTGRFSVLDGQTERQGRFAHAGGADLRHDHVIFQLRTEDGRAPSVVYNDARRFGFMDLVRAVDIEKCSYFNAMGPEPLNGDFTAHGLNAALKTRSAPIKAALLDQRVVAGLGNIYVCEALFRAGISPKRRAATVAGRRGDRLFAAIQAVLNEAIEAGGSTLRDFAGADGALGYFQHKFDVYGREGEKCRACAAPVRRLVQSGRSSFYCGACQR